MTELGLAGFDRLLEETRKALGTARPVPGEADATGRYGGGQAAGGLVRAAAQRARLRSLTLDPRALAMAPRDLAAAIVTAVNAALDDLVPPGTGTAGAGHPELTELAAKVAELQDEGLRQMAAIGQAIGDALARIREER
jgi:hypothetical protein